MAANFTASYAGIGEMLNSDFMEAAMKERAELGRAYAETVAPVGDPADDAHAGRYRESFEVSSGKHGGQKHDRAYGRVENVSPEALWVEVGSKNNEAHHVLGRAMDVMSS